MNHIYMSREEVEKAQIKAALRDIGWELFKLVAVAFIVWKMVHGAFYVGARDCLRDLDVCRASVAKTFPGEAAR